MFLCKKLQFYPQSLLLRLQVASARRLLRGRFAWHAMDRLKIPGHGTDLIRIDFPPSPDASPMWGEERPVHRKLATLLDANREEHIALFQKTLTQAEAYWSWPEHADPDRPELPWRCNPFLPAFDAVTLVAMLTHHRPRRYLEIGSGISTRIAADTRRRAKLPMEIISIDPHPRVEVENLCDRVERRPLESISAEAFLALTGPGTVVFFDGSHRSLPGSDVTWFFLELLPHLPAGTLVHVHDIYLPSDYPRVAFNRYWSEQYILAAYLLGGSDHLKIAFPCAHLAAIPEYQQRICQTFQVAPPLLGCSFWMHVDTAALAP